MPAANIMHICDSLFDCQEYCVLCLRTAESRKLADSATLTSVLELMDNSHVWPWKSRPKFGGVHNLSLCYVCEARMATTLRMLQAIHFGIQFERLLHLRRQRPTSAEHLKTILEWKEEGKGVTRHPLLHTAVSCEAGVRRVRRASAARLTDVLTVDSNPQQTDLGRLDLTQASPVTHETPVSLADPLSVIIENDIRMTDDDVSLVKEEPITTFVIEDDSDDDMPQRFHQAPKRGTKAQQRGAKAPQRGAKAPQRGAKAPQWVYKTPPQSNAPSRVNKEAQQNNVATGWANSLTSVLAAQPMTPQPMTPQFAIQSNTEGAAAAAAEAGVGQMLAVRCAQTGNFVLHQIVMGSDGVQYVPTIPARIVNGTLEPIALGAARHLAVITGDTVTVPPPAPVVFQEPPAPRDLRHVTNDRDDVLGVTITIEPDEGPAPPGHLTVGPGGLKQGPALPGHLIVGPGHLTVGPGGLKQGPPPAGRLTVGPGGQMQGPLTVAPGGQMQGPLTVGPGGQMQGPLTVGPGGQMQGPRQGPGQRAPLDEPPAKKSSIDWEDKIPMDVISYMDATDPHADSNSFSPNPAAQAPLGIISNVYSEAETAAAAHSIEDECIF